MFDILNDPLFLLQLEEYLVYDGISDHGTLEQRIMGSFMMCDQNHDREIRREEMTTVLRTANAMHNKKMPEEKFNHSMDVLMEIVDADRVCCILIS